MTVSLDGASEEVYSHSRGPGHWQRLVENLQLLLEQERVLRLDPDDGLTVANRHRATAELERGYDRTCGNGT